MFIIRKPSCNKLASQLKIGEKEPTTPLGRGSVRRCENRCLRHSALLIVVKRHPGSKHTNQIGLPRIRRCAWSCRGYLRMLVGTRRFLGGILWEYQRRRDRFAKRDRFEIRKEVVPFGEVLRLWYFKNSCLDLFLFDEYTSRIFTKASRSFKLSFCLSVTKFQQVNQPTTRKRLWRVNIYLSQPPSRLSNTNRSTMSNTSTPIFWKGKFRGLALLGDPIWSHTRR